MDWDEIITRIIDAVFATVLVFGIPFAICYTLWYILSPIRFWEGFATIILGIVISVIVQHMILAITD